MTKDEFIEFVLDEYGWELQAVICMEEMAELTKELSKFIRGKGNVEHVKEELADAELCLEEMKTAFGIDDAEIERRKQEKIDRFCERQGWQ